MTILASAKMPPWTRPCSITDSPDASHRKPCQFKLWGIEWVEETKTNSPRSDQVMRYLEKEGCLILEAGQLWVEPACFPNQSGEDGRLFDNKGWTQQPICMCVCVIGFGRSCDILSGARSTPSASQPKTAASSLAFSE